MNMPKFFRLPFLAAMLAVLAMLLVPVGPASAHDPNWPLRELDSSPDGYSGPPKKELRCLTNPERPTMVALYIYPESKAGDSQYNLDTENSKGWTRKRYIRKSIERANGIVWNSSNETQTMRWNTNANCDAAITAVPVPDNVLTSSQGAIFTYLLNQGFGEEDNRMYHLFTDTTNSQVTWNESGYGYNESFFAEDDGLIPPFKHRNHPGNGGQATFIRYMAGGWANNWNGLQQAWQGDIIAHETTHMMGAVSEAAPRSDGTYHVTEGRDLMAGYNGPSQCGSFNFIFLMDCNYNDYYAPPSMTLDASNYLSSSWNTGNSGYLYGSDYPLSNSTRAPLTPDFTLSRVQGGSVVRVDFVDDVETAGYVVYPTVVAPDGTRTPLAKKYVTNTTSAYTGFQAPQTATVEVAVTSINNQGFTKAPAKTSNPISTN